MNQSEMSEIIDGVYFEKLSHMLTNLQNWQKRKGDIFYQLYGKVIEAKMARIDNNQKEVKFQLLEFIKILNLQYSFLSKLKKQEKEVELSAAFPHFQRFANNFNTIKSSLLELNQFLGKFIGVTNYEYTEIRKLYEQAKDTKNRYEFNKTKFLHSYSQKKETMYSKKHLKKRFQLARSLELLEMVQTERKIHQQTYLRMHNIVIKDLDIRVKMYKDISDNLEYITKLYEKGFQQILLDEIRGFYSQKYQKTEEDRKNIKNNEDSLHFDQQLYKEIKQEFYKYFDIFLEEISVASWSVDFRNKEQPPQGEAAQKARMIVTFDNKIVLFKAENRSIQFQQIIEEVKVNPPGEESELQIKDKKTKQKFGISFERVEKQDEFFLHLEKMKMKK